MTQNTPIYGFPYPEFSDAPDGPTQIHNLALAVETVLARMDKPNTRVIFTGNGSLLASQVVGAKEILIRGVNGGGGSGGFAATSGANSSGGGGGAGGAYAEKLLTVPGLLFPLAVVVGAGGAAGSAAPGAGGAGGSSTVKDSAATTLWTPGVQTASQGGSAGAASATPGTTGGVGGFDSSVTGSVADLVIPGSAGFNSVRLIATAVQGVAGGSSQLGGSAAANSTMTALSLGFAGQLYGGGAASGQNNGTGALAAHVGLAGAAGIVIIDIFF